MFRMTTFALAAAATLAATAAIPATASAHGWRHHHRHHHGVVVRFSAPYYAYAPRCYTTKRWVHTYWGWRLQRIRHCR